MYSKIALTISVLLITIIAFSNNNLVVENIDTEDIQRDVVVDLNAKVYGSKAYFNLVMLNESKNGVYSLVRFNSDSTLVSIGLIDAVPNKINQKLVYSFHDDELPNSDAQYVLYRLGDTSEQLITWKYHKENNEVYESEPYTYK